MEQKSESFEVVNKRRVNVEGEAPKPEAPAAEAPQAEAPAAEEPQEERRPTDEEMAEAVEELARAGMPNVDIHSLLASFVGMLHTFAWQKMGFMANPATKQVEEDLPQAKVAIDTVQFLIGQLEPKMPAEEMRELRRLVMDLQMNFLRKSSGS